MPTFAEQPVREHAVSVKSSNLVKQRAARIKSDAHGRPPTTWNLIIDKAAFVSRPLCQSADSSADVLTFNSDADELFDCSQGLAGYSL